MKTIDDFKEAIIKKNINWWPVHNCSLCGYECGYIFSDYGTISYDHGCHCTRRVNISTRNWEDVLEVYKMQTNEKVIKEMNEFWGFE